MCRIDIKNLKIILILFDYENSSLVLVSMIKMFKTTSTKPILKFALSKRLLSIKNSSVSFPSTISLPKEETDASCTTRFTPRNEHYNTLRHIHFPGITTFEEGQKIQDFMVRSNLDFKKIESNISKQRKEVHAKGYTLSEYEEGLLDKILEVKPRPTIVTFEFENVYTGGKKMKQDPSLKEKIKDYEKLGCKYHQLERGGQVTWHGKGHLVAYIYLDIKHFKNLTVKCYVESVLLKSLQNLLKNDYGLSSYTNENPGIWMTDNEGKIASVGCNIQRGITSYGIGLNVNPDLKFLNTYTMCGLPNASATSINDLNSKIDDNVEKVGFNYAHEVGKLLNVNTVEHMIGDRSFLEG